jgi:hypothetical protein
VFLKAIHSKLSADATLTAMLSTYEGEPAIFTVDPAPEGAEMPFIVVSPIIDGAPFDTKTSRGRSVRVDVRCYAEATGSSSDIEAISERVRSVLHRVELTIDGHAWEWSSCFGPISADEADAYGRIITVAVTATETD